MKSNRIQQDYDLIRKINDGDTSAFRQLVYVYKDVSLSLAVSIIRDATVAEDVLQDVFIKVYHKLHTFQYKSSFSTWLYRIVVNTCYNKLKRKKNSLDIENTMETLRLESPQRDTIGEDDQKKFINIALQQLRPDEALVLRLFYLCEYKIREIQEVTGFKTSKIKVDLHRGRENMLFQLKKVLGDDLKHLL